MSTTASCPFCSCQVAPARTPTGALMCPICHNTGRTGRADLEALQQELRTFQERIVDHVSRVQRLVDDVAHAPGTADVDERLTRLEDEVRNQTARAEAAATATAMRLMETPRADEVDERVTQLADRLENMSARMDAATTATAIRLDSEASTKNMDDLVGAVDALRHDIRELHEEYDRASIPALRHQVKVLAASVRSLEKTGTRTTHAWEDDTTAEWQRPEPDTVDEAEIPRWSTSAVRTDDDGATERTLEEPLAAAAAAGDPFRTAVGGPESDFSGVPPVMHQGGSMRDLVARDAMAMSGTSREGQGQGYGGGSDPLDDIETALHDIDTRLRTLRDR